MKIHQLRTSSCLALLLCCSWEPTKFFVAGADSAGCSNGGSISSGRINIVVDGVSRSFLLYVPSSAGSSPKALVLNFHGNPSDAATQQAYTQMDTTAEKHGFFVAYPDGINTAFNAGACCAGATADDLAFSRKVVDEVASKACINLDQVFATGWSNGAYMAYFLACKAADMVSAIAPVGGLIGVDPVNDCTPSRPVRVLHMHEVKDGDVDYCGKLRVEFMGAQALVREFAAKQGCSGSGDTGISYQKGEVTCRSQKGCPGGRNATLCTIDRCFASHSWPGAESNLQSEDGTKDIDGNEEIWQFFAGNTAQSDSSLTADNCPNYCGAAALRGGRFGWRNWWT